MAVIKPKGPKRLVIDGAREEAATKLRTEVLGRLAQETSVREQAPDAEANLASTIETLRGVVSGRGSGASPTSGCSGAAARSH